MEFINKYLLISFTCKHTVACFDNCIISPNTHAQVYHQEHGYIHDNALN